MFFRTTSSALALIAFAAPALADVTPAEVWQNWVDYYKANGYTVTEGSREEAGETLALKDVVLEMTVPNDEGHIKFAIPEVNLTGTGDGKVRTTMAEKSDFSAEFKNGDDEKTALAGTVTMKDAELISSGSASDMTHDSKAGEIDVALTSVKTGDKETQLPLSLRFKNMAFNQNVVDGDLTKIAGKMSADRIEFEGKLADADSDDGGKISVNFNGSADNFASEGTMSMPKGLDMSKDPNAALKAGWDLDGSVSVGDGSMTFDLDEQPTEGEPVKMSGNSTFKGFDISAAMSTAGLKYQGSTDKASVEMTSSQMPFPISYAVDSGTFDIQFPLMKADEPVPFKMAYSIGGLTFGDQLWDLFDAGKKLPRDPASLDVDVTGMVRVLADLMDPKSFEPTAEATETDTDTDADGDTEITMEDVESTPEPIMPTEVTINKLALEAVGAKIDATGNLAFTDGGSIDDPVGKLNAKIDGANGLIDKLVEMGLVPGDQVAGIRMMLAMFAKPAPEGGDSLVSELEFREGGQVFANGQQVK